MIEKVVNCTPHPIVVRTPDGLEVVFEPSGIIPRVSTVEVEAEEIAWIPCIRQEAGEVTGLPDPKPGTFYIVSRMVFDASGRKDLIAPDTGKEAIRDEKGRILAVTRFIRRGGCKWNSL